MPARALQEKDGVSFLKSWLSSFGNVERESPKNIYTSLKFVTVVRCIYAVLVLAYSLLWVYTNSYFKPDLSTQLLFGSIIEIFIFTALCCIILLRKKFIRPITYISMLHDALLAAFIVMLTGGHSSPFFYLFLIIPLYGGIILQRRGGAIGACIVSGVLVITYLSGSLIANILPPGQRELFELLILTYSDSYMRMLSLVLACFGVGILTGQLAHQYARVQADLIESDREFSHLRGIYEILLNALPVGIVILNPHTNRLLYANPCAKNLIDLEDTQAAFETVLQSEQAQAELEVGRTWQCEYRGKYLQIARFELSLSEDTQLNGYHISDSTTLHQIQLELVRRQRMELLGEFSAKVAHEIRNPLACISGCNEMLQCDAQNEDQKELLTMMGDEINRLNNLINDILLFSRRPKLKPELLQLSGFLEKRKSVFLNDTQNAEIQIEIDVPKTLEFLADETSLAQIVMTLWRNSAEAMEGKGKIRVCLAESMLQFYDEGPGLTEELAKHVFEPFYTTKPSGTGLGLSIARQLALDNTMILSWNPTLRCFELLLFEKYQSVVETLEAIKEKTLEEKNKDF